MELVSPNTPIPPRWFEFLLEPERLGAHLELPSCEPSPTQLIDLFFKNLPTLRHSTQVQKYNQDSFYSSPWPNEDSNSNLSSAGVPVETILATNETADVLIAPDSYEARYRTKKAHALQTLALQVASYLKWDLDIICNELSIPVQYKLMLALTKATAPDNCPQEVKKFAQVLYSHWFLRSAVAYQLSNLQPQSNNTTIIYLSQLQQQQEAADTLALSSMRELFSASSKQLEACSTALYNYIRELTQPRENAVKRMRESSRPLTKAKLSRPTMNCFNLSSERLNDWTLSADIESERFLLDACYSLGKFFFFEECYGLAKYAFDIINQSDQNYPKLADYIRTSTELDRQTSSPSNPIKLENRANNHESSLSQSRRKTEEYLFNCMAKFSKSQTIKVKSEQQQHPNDLVILEQFEKDSDLRFDDVINVPPALQQQQLIDAARGIELMSRGSFKEAMSCFVSILMLTTDYFRFFSTDYVDEEPYISRMIQCSISLSCFTQAVALCQMAKNLNYTIAFKQLNERVCNDCCDDIYECIWDVTLLEYIINLHSKRGEVERRSRIVQLIGQLELNENNPIEILKEAESMRRGRFFRIMSNKYL